jgi:hypothetical protein
MMPCGLFVVLPTIGWSWPALAPIAAGVAAAMGYRSLTKGQLRDLLDGRLNARLHATRRHSLAIDSVLTEVIAEDLGAEERMAFERDGVTIVFRKDGRGKFHVDAVGPATETTLSLKIRGEEFARELVKKFAYHKMIEQIQKRGATVVEETVKENGDIVLLNRQWR